MGAMTTDNRANEPTDEQVEAAAKALRADKANRTDTYRVPDWEDTPYGDKLVYRGQARAALVAAAAVAALADAWDEGLSAGFEAMTVGKDAPVPGNPYRDEGDDDE